MSDTRRRSPAESRHLYAIAGLWTRRVKIGRAACVWSRLAQLQAGSGEELCLLAWASDRGFREQSVQWAFREHHVHGEWFSPVLTAVIAKAVGSELLRVYQSPRFEQWADQFKGGPGPIRGWRDHSRNDAFTPSRTVQADAKRHAIARLLGRSGDQ